MYRYSFLDFENGFSESFGVSESPRWGYDVDWDAKFDSVEYLTDLDSVNYSCESGFFYLEPVDIAVSMARQVFGVDSDIEDHVKEVRDYLRDLGKYSHANQLDGVLISPEVCRDKISCRNVKGGNGRHPGDLDGMKKGGSGVWTPGDYEDHPEFIIRGSEDVFDVLSL